MCVCATYRSSSNKRIISPGEILRREALGRFISTQLLRTPSLYALVEVYYHGPGKPRGKTKKNGSGVGRDASRPTPGFAFRPSLRDESKEGPRIYRRGCPLRHVDNQDARL